MSKVKVFRLFTMNKVKQSELAIAAGIKNDLYEVQPSCLVAKADDFATIAEEVKEAGLGDRFMIEVDEMEEDEVDNLPEFDGF
ncbi:MAG TPA: hypothetical protein VHO03_03735 [Ignavibacteriales bacterium]|nr:hypothetical protein [Ignavibacteriales bacterium]